MVYIDFVVDIDSVEAAYHVKIISLHITGTVGALLAPHRANRVGTARSGTCCRFVGTHGCFLCLFHGTLQFRGYDSVGMLCHLFVNIDNAIVVIFALSLSKQLELT